MRLRYRKKTINRQSLFNIRFARFIAELNQTAEEVYRSLDEVVGSDEAETETTDENPRDGRSRGATDPPQDPV